MRCPKCHLNSMAQMASDKPGRKCLNCGQEFHPFRFSAEALADLEAAVARQRKARELMEQGIYTPDAL